MNLPDIPPALVGEITRIVNSRDGRQQAGGEIRFRCPCPENHKNRDAKPAARWNPEKHVWRCDVCGVGGGALDLAKRLDIDLSRYRDPPRPTSKGKPRRTTWEIRDKNGVHVATHVRIDKPDGSKSYVWELPDGRSGLGGMKTADLPLYGIDRLNDRPGLIVIEGEQTTDALLGLGLAAVGTVTGAASAPGEKALTPLMDKTSVYLWADNDDAGRSHMARIAARLVDMGHNDVRLLDWSDAPPKGDAADFVATGGTADDVRRLARDARAWESNDVTGDEAQVDGPPPPLGELLDAIAAFVARFIVLTQHQRDTIALWTAHTHALDAADQTPYLSITSAEKRSGKTRLLELLALLVARSWFTGRTTAAALVRKMDAVTPTLLLDESDTAFKGDKEYSETLRGVLNSGHRRGGAYTACIGQGANLTFKDFGTFGPKAIAGIGKLPDTVTDRSIPIELKRKKPGEHVERLRARKTPALAQPARAALCAWATGDVLSTLADAEPDLPDALDDRAADGWEPLLAIADLAGGDWPERATAAALALSAGEARDDDSLGVRLLADVRSLFGGESDRLTTSAILTSLNAADDAPWGGFHDGEGMKARDLANILRRYDIKPTTIRIDGKTPKGYPRSAFDDAWSRYLPQTPPDKRNIRNIGGNTGKTAPQHPQHEPEMLRIETADFPDSDANVADVADSEGGYEPEHPTNQRKPGNVYESIRACSCGNRWYRRTSDGKPDVCTSCGNAAA